MFRGRRSHLSRPCVARWNWIQAVGSWTICLAGDGVRCGGADRGEDELSAESDRLAQPTAHVAATEGGLGSKNVLRCRRKDASTRLFCDSIRAMGDGRESLPDDIETLKATLIIARAEAAAARKLSRRNDVAKPMATCSSAGVRSLASSTTVASACRTTPPNAPCAASLGAGSRGCSVAPIAVATVLR